jgi:dihydrofolate reductase
MNAILCTYDGFIIGVGGKMPWEVIPNLRNTSAVRKDLEMFKKITADKIVVMGRKTWLSLGSRPLPKRKQHIVITSNPEEIMSKNSDFYYKNNIVFMTLEKFKELDFSSDDYWLIGGKKLYCELIPYCQQVYINNISLNPNIYGWDLEANRGILITANDIFDVLNNNNFTSNTEWNCRFNNSLIQWEKNISTIFKSEVYFKDYRK